MCGGVVPQYAITEMETWSCLSVPPPALHAERPRRKVPPDRYINYCTSSSACSTSTCSAEGVFFSSLSLFFSTLSSPLFHAAEGEAGYTFMNY